MAQAKRDLRAEITQQIIDLMTTHGAGWTKPFSSLAGAPTNALTGNAYRGMNGVWLGLQGETYWATYCQWQELGGQVIKDQKASKIAVPMEVKDKKTEEIKGLYFRPANVFSAAQIEGWEAPEISTPDTTAIISHADSYLSACGADVRHNDGGRAFYNPGNDFIQMPKRAAFEATTTSNSTENYYSTLLHEHAHWTGHQSRLDRLNDRSNRGYAFEELVAELSAAMLCATLQVTPTVRADHAQYISGWLSVLTTDNGAEYIWKAATQAQRAVDFLNAKQEQPTAAAA